MRHVYLGLNALLTHSHKKRKDSLEAWGQTGPFFFITWVPKIIGTPPTRAYMKYKQNAAEKHRADKSKRIIFVLCPDLKVSGESCLIFNWHGSRAASGMSFFIEYQQRMTNTAFLAVCLKKNTKTPRSPFSSIPLKNLKPHLSWSLQHSTLNK